MTSRLGDLLWRRGMLTAEQLAAVCDDGAESGGLAARLVDLGLAPEHELVATLADAYRLPVVDPRTLDVPRAALEAIPHGVARRRQLVPVALEGARLTVATADPTDDAGIAEVRFLSGLDVGLALAAPTAVRDAIARLYGDAEDLADALSGLGPASPPPVAEERGGGEPSRPDASPVVRYVQALLIEAVRRRASDIHIEPYDRALRVRLRVDGVLAEVLPPPPALAGAITTRIKVMAQLDIAERRLPQDGRLGVRHPDGVEVDVRVSSLPTLYGETLVLRLLDRAQMARPLDALGLDDDGLAALRGALAQPHGLVLATGPTGSGKTTTLYAALAALNTPAVNICTVEDPVEFHLHGVNQVSARDDIGLSFAAALRALLRQDPDVIMVGEIRDLDTADIAVKAALTGHLVLATLHTNDAPSAVTRLLDMGIPSFLIAGSLLLVVAQRLVRVVCRRCAAPDPLANEALRAVAAEGDARRGAGCSDCAGSGFRGRAAVYQLMPAGDPLRECIAAGGSLLELRRLAGLLGMRTLRGAGLAAAARGLTTLEEVLRVTPADATP